MKKKWWQEAVVYEIHCKSFCDFNGDVSAFAGAVMVIKTEKITSFS